MATGDVETFHPDHQWHIAEVRRLQEQYGDALQAGLERLLAAMDQS